MRAGRLTLGCTALLQIATAQAHGMQLELASSASGSKVLIYLTRPSEAPPPKTTGSLSQRRH